MNYIVPGLLGSWLTVRMLGKFKQRKKAAETLPNSST